MRRCTHLVAVLVLLTITRVMAQPTAEQEVRRANDEILLAVVAGDKAAYTRLLGDDLRWIDGNGRQSSKAERIAGLISPADRGAPPTRTFRDVDVKVYGTTAILFMTSDFLDRDRVMQSQIVHRVFMNRDGQWQLVSHSPTPLAPVP
jgi:ketosteroid isomerase-like protein